MLPAGFQNGSLNSYLTGPLGLGTSEAEEYIKATVFSATVHEHEAPGIKDNRLDTVSRAMNTGLTPPPPVTMVYDANGNLTDDGVYLYGYDALNRQVRVTEKASNSLLAEYVYLTSGERVAAVKYAGGAASDYVRYFREGAAVVWEHADSVGHAKSYVYANGRMAYTHEAWRECLIQRVLTGSSAPTLGTPTVTALAGSETATAEFDLASLPAEAEAVEVRVVKGNSLVGSQRFERPEGGWCGLEHATFAGLPEGADYQAGLTVFVREGRAKVLPPNAYLVERMKLGLVRGKVAAWTVARFKEEGDQVEEETTTGFASLAPEGAQDYTAKAKKGSQSEVVAQGQQAEEVTLPTGSTAVAVEGSAGVVTLGTPTLRGGGGGTLRCTDYAIHTYYGVDHLGTVRYTRAYSTTNSITTVSETTHDYEPFGVELPGKDACGNTHQFTGHERDAETGNDYMHFRMFAANMGRFMKPDDQYDKAEANPQGFNLYTYVKGNPVNLNDPTGHWGGDYHFAMTAIAMLSYGFTEEEAISTAEDNVSVDTNTATSPFTAFSLGNSSVMQTFHGFPAEGESRDDAIIRCASIWGLKADSFMEYVGKDLHCIQDPYSHGGYRRGFHGIGADSTKKHYSEAIAAFDATLRQVSRLSAATSSASKIFAGNQLIRLVASGRVILQKNKIGKLTVKLPWYRRKKRGQADLAQAQEALSILTSQEQPAGVGKP